MVFQGDLHLSHWLFQPSCYTHAILEYVLHLQNVKTILERKTLACCPPKCLLTIVVQNLNSHMAVHCLYSLSLKKWTFTDTFPVRNSECKFPKLHLSYYLKTNIVALYLANKCYRIYHKHIYSIKIMAGKKQESTALWNVPHEVSVSDWVGTVLKTLILLILVTQTQINKSK